MQNLFALPKGYASYPVLVTPKSVLPDSPEKYSISCFIKAEDFMSHPQSKNLLVEYREQAKKLYKRDVELRNIEKCPIKNLSLFTEEELSIFPDQVRSGYIMVRASCSASIPPRIQNQYNQPASEEEKKSVLGGSMVRIVVNVFTPKTMKNGPWLSLNTVQIFPGQGVEFTIDGMPVGRGNGAQLLDAEEIPPLEQSIAAQASPQSINANVISDLF